MRGGGTQASDAAEAQHQRQSGDGRTARGALPPQATAAMRDTRRDDEVHPMQASKGLLTTSHVESVLR